MVFITQADLESYYTLEEIRQIADRDGDGNADPSVVQQAIDRAESLVKSRLAVRVALPLTTVSDQVKDITGALARYNLYPYKAPPEVEARRDQAMGELEAFARGKTTLGLDAPVPGDSPIDYAAPDRVFTMETLRGF
jgi:phage gp36-like protein